MSLHLDEVSLSRWRNIPSKDVELAGGITIFLGRNACGKTNTIEALQLLTSGVSFRHPSPAELVQDGEGRTRASASLVGDGRHIDIEVDVDVNRRTFLRNGKPVRPSSLMGTMMSVLFNPDDLALVKTGASRRRDEIDDFGSQVNKGYSQVRGSYRRAIEQRNRLLKEEVVDLALLDAWDESIAIGGATLLYHRLRLFSRLSEGMAKVHSQIVPSEHVECTYSSTLSDNMEALSREELCELLRRALRVGREEDIRRRQTTVGPHRDDIAFLIDGRDARTYGSQGQQRSIVLAWKMAEVEFARQVTGQTPLLLLDDVMSELDSTRRVAIVDFLSTDVQTVITTTNLGYFSDGMVDASKVVSFDGR